MFFNILSQDDWVKAVKSVINSEPDLKLSYGKVVIEYLTQNMTLVPDKFFSEEDAEAVFRFNLMGEKGTKVLSLSLGTSEAQLVYSIDEELSSFFKKTYSSAEIRHAAAPLVNTLLAKEENGQMLYAYVQPSLLQIILTEKKQLKYCNTFSYRTPEDFIYYLMYAVHQLELDNEKIPLILLGEVIEDSAIYRQAFKYIRNISFGKRPEWLQLSDEFKLPQHFYFNLFCEV